MAGRTRGRGLGASALFKIPPDSLTRTCSAHLLDLALRDGPVSSLNPALGRLWPKAGPVHWQHRAKAHSWVAAGPVWRNCVHSSPEFPGSPPRMPAPAPAPTCLQDHQV